jgi:hypothetical protein
MFSQHKKNIARIFLTAVLLNLSVSILCAAGVDVRSLLIKPQQTLIKKHHGSKPCTCPNKKGCCSEEVVKYNGLDKQVTDEATIKHFSDDLIIHPAFIDLIITLSFTDTKVKPVARWVYPPPHDDIRVFIRSFLI